MLSSMMINGAVWSLLASAATAHMVITSPVPYGQSSLNNGPLLNDGSDFPCKQRPGVYDVTKMNNMAVGDHQTLAFMGGATHGGGSCQVSITLDKEPTKNSQWKVIHSILGGCPSNATGNLSDDAKGTNAAVFDYTIPQGMPNGQYTLAWTWFNKIGNREMYMNCAPITVTGGADNNDVFDKLPDMFVINIPNQQCATVEGEDFVFPNPGDSVQTAFSTALGSKTIGSGCAAMTAKGRGSGQAGSPEAAAPTSPAMANAIGGASFTAAPTGSLPAAPVYSAPATTTTLVTVTGGSGSNGGGGAYQTQAPPPVVTAPANPGAGAGSAIGSCSGGSVSCSSPGSIICIGSNQWGTCDTTMCAVPMALAAGTSCANGAITKRSSRFFQRRQAELAGF